MVVGRIPVAKNVCIKVLEIRLARYRGNIAHARGDNGGGQEARALRLAVPSEDLNPNHSLVFSLPVSTCQQLSTQVLT